MLNLVSDIPAQWKATKVSDGITVQQAHVRLLARAAERVQAHHDVRDVDLSRYQAHQASGEPLTLHSSHGLQKFSVREHAFGQLCTQIGAPAKYLRQLPTETALQCLNHGIAKFEGSKRTFRMVGQSVRAIVSERYADLDDLPALHMLAEAVGGRELYLTGYGQSVGTTVARFVSPTLFDGPDGKPLQIGLDFMNSEVGSGTVRLRGCIYRQVCTNGLVIELGKGVASKWRHIGDSTRLYDAFTNLVPHVLTGTEEALYKVAAAHGRIMNVTTARGVLQNLQLTDGQQLQSLTDALAEAGVDAAILGNSDAEHTTTLTGWHLINGLTHAAQSAEPATRVAMETEAGQLLTMAA